MSSEDKCSFNPCLCGAPEGTDKYPVLVKYQGEKRFPGGGSADSGSIQQKGENNPMSEVILLLEEILLTFGTELIAFSAIA